MNFNLPEEPVEGIVLRTFPSRDSDLVLRILTTTHGKLPALAKSARRQTKKFSQNFDVFDRGIFSLKVGRGSLPIVESFAVRPGFKSLRTNLHKLSAASVICEAFDVLMPEYGHEEGGFYEILSATLDAIDQGPELKVVLRACYEGLLALLTRSGYVDPEKEPPPSARALLDLISRAEGFAERQLVSKVMLWEALGALKAAAN